MKKYAMTFAALLAACGTMLAATSKDELKFHLSTPLTVGETQMPAGDFIVRVMESNNGNTIISVRSESGAQVLVLANPINNYDSEADNATVDLQKKGSAYSLDKVWMGAHSGFQLLQ